MSIRDDILLPLKVASAASLGLYAGGALYINACEAPANLDNSDMEVARTNWTHNFAHASKFAPVMEGLACGTALLHYILSRGTVKEDLPFLLGVAAAQINLPVSLVILMPINNQLHNEEQCRKEGSTYIRNLLEQWNVRHAVRTVVGVGAFTFVLYRLAKGKH